MRRHAYVERPQDDPGGDLFNRFLRETYVQDAYRPWRSAMAQAVPFTVDREALTLTYATAYDMQINMRLCRAIRRLARLPYEHMWIEFRYMDRVAARGRASVSGEVLPSQPVDEGFLLSRTGDATWKAILVCAGEQGDPSKADSLLTWFHEIHFSPDVDWGDGFEPRSRDHDVHAAAKALANNTTIEQAAWGFYNAETGDLALPGPLLGSIRVDITPEFEQMLLRQPAGRVNTKLVDALETSLKETMGDGCLIAILLCLINQVPMTFKDYSDAPGRTFRGGGMIRPYRVNRHVRIALPKTRLTPKALARRFLGAERKMSQHWVRGHYISRKDRPATNPENWVLMYSPRHGEDRWHHWRGEFSRGDPEVGIIARRTYDVTGRH